LAVAFVQEAVPTGVDDVVLQVMVRYALPAFGDCGVQLATSVGPVVSVSQ